ncbi:MAG: biotin--[acetyl-CoA-carboxylase] ligase [Phycisphaerales bacterium]
MAAANEDITGWADRIEHAIETIDGCCVSEVFVYQRVSSTQDAAFRHRHLNHVARGGVVAIASEQTDGRGRRGRQWDDGESHTLPVSIAMESDLADVSLAARAGLAALDSCADRVPDSKVLIKWPNDIVVRADGIDRKLAGVLIERREGIAIVGVGINVRSFDTTGEYHPISFEDLGARVERCELAIGLIDRLSYWLSAPEDLVKAHWREFDAMLGTLRAFSSNSQTVRGRVISLDPLVSIELQTNDGRRSLDVATTQTV